MQDNKDQDLTQLGRLRGYLITAAIMVFLVILAGGIVRATEASGSCLDWPTCLDSWLPPQQNGALIDYTHRITTLLAAAMILISTITAWMHFRRQRRILWPLIASTTLLVAQILLGAWLSQTETLISSWISALHMGLSLTILASLIVSLIITFYPHTLSTKKPMRFSSPFARLSLLTAAALFLLLVSGTIVSASGANAACQTWPLCEIGFGSDYTGVWIQSIHRTIVGLSGILLFVLLIQAWRTQRSQTPIIASTSAAATLFVAQALLGSQLIGTSPQYLIVLHQATATAVWAAIMVQTITVGMAARTAFEERQEAQIKRQPSGMLKDLLALTKPIVVALLLVTTYAGMVIGAQAWPPLTLTVATLVGGFLAAGGSGAINQYIDRADDRKMQRTQKRPIPSGRLTPGEGLATGIMMTITSFYIMVAFVNLTGALLTLAGIIYYVLLYSIFLKKTTVQNIVIGGGAGAIPPLVGWAAATGSLNVPSLFLFALVFMWTPPHFWALALVRRKDYARAGVPMLPVIRGEKETRRQILIYTLELVGLTLLLPLFGLGGAIYLLGAAVLGLWLLAAAWKVWKQGGNKVAWKMYRYSSMYLAFIFLVLMIDRLI